MTTQKEATFVSCQCPACKKPLDEMPVSTKSCPFCHQPLDPSAVWMTRKYEGVVELPNWVRAFGWPFLLMIAGVGWFCVTHFIYHYMDVLISAFLFSVGLIFFIIKLHSKGR